MSRFSVLADALRLLRSELDKRSRSCLAIALILVIVGGVLAALAPLALKDLVDAVAAPSGGGQGDEARTALLDGIAYALVLICARLLSDVRPLVSGTLNQRLHARLTRRFFDHLMRLPMAYLLRRRSGELLHSLDLATTGFQLVVAHVVNSIMPVLVEIIAMAAILAHLGQPALIAVFGATATAYLAIFAAGSGPLSRQAQGVSAASLESYAQLTDGLLHAETLRCCAAEREAQRRLELATITLESRWFTLHRTHVGIALAVSAAFALSITASLMIAADAVASGAITIGGFVLANAYMLQMVRPLEVLGSAARELSQALGFVRPLLDILREPAEPSSGQERPIPAVDSPRTGPGPALRFDNVDFGYEPRRPVIRGLDLEVQAGRTTAIVGASGSGKSSLVRLLLRLYSPQSGRILLDGHSIDTLPAAQLRALIGLVPQDTSLLNASIASNIALGQPDASREEIARAACDAQLHDLIARLPDGYDTLVGERGFQLSGGERQRIAIARALLRRPAIFVLDEPTSMLDSATEVAILNLLKERTAGSTTLVIAHRLSTVMHADEIVVLDGGRIRERGDHERLLAMGGVYSRFWRQQMGGSA